MTVARIVEPRNTDITVKNREKIAVLLGDVLTSTYELLLASQLVHWNAKGNIFLPVHQLTETHYKALFETLDIIAERMRALGTEVPVNGVNKEFSIAVKLTSSDIPHMIEQLAKLHEGAAAHAREVASKCDEAGDIVTTDMLVDCMKFHEKAVWMLRAIIAK